MQIYTTKMKTQSMVLALLLVGACHKPLTWETPRYMREQGRFAAFAKEGDSEKEEDPSEDFEDTRRLYITAFRGDSIVLFRDFIEVASAPAGENPDPDRHRICDGHLWSDALEGKETVVFRDGEELFRWPGEELLLGFTVRDGKVYTLGQRPGSQGFCYRIDGKEVFSDPSGRIVGAIPGREWDGVNYCYGIPIQHGSGTTWEYRVMNGAETVRVIADDAVGAVLDMLLVDGRVYRLEKRGDDVRFVSPRGAFSYGPASRVSIVRINDDVCVRGHNPSGTACWYRYNSKVLAWEDGAELYYDGFTRVWWTLEDGLIGQMYFDKSALDIPRGRYSLSTPSCAGFFGPTFCAALTDTIGQEHLIVTNTTLTPFHLDATSLLISICKF